MRGRQLSVFRLSRLERLMGYAPNHVVDRYEKIHATGSFSKCVAGLPQDIARWKCIASSFQMRESDFAGRLSISGCFPTAMFIHGLGVPAPPKANAQEHPSYRPVGRSGRTLQRNSAMVNLLHPAMKARQGQNLPHPQTLSDIHSAFAS